MRLAALILALLCGCGAFHRNATVQTAKEVVKALPAAVAALQESAEATRDLATTVRVDVAPAVTHTLEAWDEMAHAATVLLKSPLVKGLLAVLALGSLLGYFSLAKTAVRYVKKRLERRKSPKP